MIVKRTYSRYCKDELTYQQVVKIGEHTVRLPELPVESIKIPSSVEGMPDHTVPVDELIINLDKKNPDDAYWNRVYLPRYFYHYIPGITEMWANETTYKQGVLKSLSEEDTLDMIYYFDRETYRRKHGVFMRNGNDIEYLTEDYYFFLQYVKPYGVNDANREPWREEGWDWGEFRKFQMEIFQLMRKVKYDPDILGLYIAKPKKTGVTQILCAYYLNKATLTRASMLGIMSKGNEAAATNMLFFFHGFDSLPMVFKPVTRDRADVDGKIFFAEPAIKSLNTKGGMDRFVKAQMANPLNTKVWAAKTKEAGFDAPVMNDVWFDEFAKYDTENKVDPAVIWERNSETVKLQDFYNGRIWVTFYPPETNTRGFMQARELYFNSKLSTKGKNGRTASGLITLHISALNAYKGCFDKFGNCNQVLAAAKNKDARDAVKHDKQKYQSKIRQYSETEKECWSISAAGSTFDNVRLGDLLTDLEADMKSERFYEDGRLEWERPLWETSTYDQRPLKKFCPVKWIPLTEEEIFRGEKGRLRFYQKIPKGEQNQALRYGSDRKGNLYRVSPITNVGGTDPTDYAADAEVITGSKNASFTMNLPDLLMDNQYGRIASKIILSEYFYRPDNPLEFYEDLVKEIIYTGKVVIVEANKKWVATKLIADGLGRYMIVKQKSTGKFTFWSPELEEEGDYSFISMQTDDLETLVRVISRYIIKPREGETAIKDYGSMIKSERLLDQLTKFSKERSKFFDLVIAFGWTLVAMEVVMTPEEIDLHNQIYNPSLVAQIFHGLMTSPN